MTFPAARPRRLRRTAALRRLAAQVRLSPADLVLPVFVKEGIGEPQPIASMPGVVQHTRESARKAAVEAVEAGVGGIIVFGIPAVKDARGSAADDPDGVVQVVLSDLAAEVGERTVLMAVLCERSSSPVCRTSTPPFIFSNEGRASFSEFFISRN